MNKKKSRLRIDRIIIAVLALAIVVVICAVIIPKVVTSISNTITSSLSNADADDDSADADADSVDTDADSADTDADSDETISTTEVGVADTTVDWNLILVNPWYALPDDFTVELATLINGLEVDARIYDPLYEMLDAASAAGHDLIVCSAYRSMEKQTALFTEDVESYIAEGYSAEDAALVAATSTAVPGTSEHQTGLAVDIVALDYQLLNDEQGEQEEQQWLMENCYKYGFVLRYQADKEDITTIIYEPWHYRYVGVEAATEMYELDLCLEEYTLYLAGQ